MSKRLPLRQGDVLLIAMRTKRDYKVELCYDCGQKRKNPSKGSEAKGSEPEAVSASAMPPDYSDIPADVAENMKFFDSYDPKAAGAGKGTNSGK